MTNHTTVEDRFSPRELAAQVGVATFGRLLLNTARRFPYTFASALSAGLGVPLTAITSLIAINQAATLLSMFFGPLADRLGYRMLLLGALGTTAVGMFAAGWLPFYGMVVVALFLAGMGKGILSPVLQAYWSRYVPFHRRAMVIGIAEFGWAGSTLIGIPVAGWLIQVYGWQAPFLMIGSLGIVTTLVLAWLIPSDVDRTAPRMTSLSMGKAWRLLGGERAALGALGFAFFNGAANDNLFVVYGVWLEQDFALSYAALGLATIVIGVAELTGEGVTATLADRIGLKRGVIWGMVLCTIAYALLPFMRGTLTLSLVGLFLVFLTFEFSVVTSFSLFTEVIPGARATMMAAVFAVASLGRILGAVGGGFIWQWGGLPASALTSTLLNALAVGCVVWGFWHWHRDSDT